MTLYKWLQASGSNANVDATVNWAEGQAPSTVNDSARGMMAAIAKYRDDTAGAIVTGGTSTAYTVSSYQVFDTLVHLNGQMIAFTPHVANGATVTLNVDSLGAKPLRTSPNVELQSGVLIQGTPYIAVYNSADGAFYLRGVGPSPGIPLGCGIDYWGSSTPSSAFAFPVGQTISQTTYAPLFSLFGTTYNTGGEPAGTFRLPDKTGRVSAMKESSASRLTLSWFGGDSTALGATGSGNEKNALSNTNQLPQFTPSGSVASSVNNFINQWLITDGVTMSNVTAGAAPRVQAQGTPTITSTFTGNVVGSASPSSFRTVQPTIICNYIIRVI
jgi:microcystin-dependent protein